MKQHSKDQLEKECYFCSQGINYIDYKDRSLKKFISPYAKIMSRKKTGVCAKHQRKLSIAIKRARFVGFYPFFVQ